jgi:hypothetical protein
MLSRPTAYPVLDELLLVTLNRKYLIPPPLEKSVVLVKFNVVKEGVPTYKSFVPSILVKVTSSLDVPS